MKKLLIVSLVLIQGSVSLYADCSSGMPGKDEDCAAVYNVVARTSRILAVKIPTQS